MSTLMNTFINNVRNGTIGMSVAVVGSLLLAAATFTPWLIVAVALA